MTIYVHKNSVIMAIYCHVYCTVQNFDGKNIDRFVKILDKQPSKCSVTQGKDHFIPSHLTMTSCKCFL